MLAPVQRNSLCDQVFAQLRDQIVSGARAPGDALPSERVLAETLGINRGAVREALRQLVQARLIAVKQGSASRVLDFRETGGIELLGALIVDAQGAVNTEVVRSIMEMRSVLAPAIAASAARRDCTRMAERFHETVTALASATDNAERSLRSREFWGLLVDASNNIAYRLAFNSLNETTARLDTLLGDVLSTELNETDAYRSLAEQVLAGDAAAAFTRASSLMSIGERAINSLLQVVETERGEKQ